MRFLRWKRFQWSHVKKSHLQLLGNRRLPASVGSLLSSAHRYVRCVVRFHKTYPTLHLLRLLGGDVCWCFKVQHGFSSFLFILFFVFHLVMKSLINTLFWAIHRQRPVKGSYFLNDTLCLIGRHLLAIQNGFLLRFRSSTFSLLSGRKMPLFSPGHHQDLCSIHGDKRLTVEESAQRNTDARKCMGKLPIEKVGQDWMYKCQHFYQSISQYFWEHLQFFRYKNLYQKSGILT